MKCAYCFLDAGEQTCATCYASCCNNHVTSGLGTKSPVCTGNHETPKAAPKSSDEDDSSPKPRVRSTKPKDETA